MARVRRIKRRKVNKAAREAAQADIAMASAAEESQAGEASKVVIVGDRIFNLRLSKLVSEETDFNVVATAATVMEARAYPNEHKADLTVVDVDFGGTNEGVVIARDLNERRPGSGIMIVCGPFTSNTAKTLWVYGADAWSVVTQATAKNPAHFAEAVSSAVHGMTWIEPGVARELQIYGPRPNSFDERRLMMMESNRSDAA